MEGFNIDAQYINIQPIESFYYTIEPIFNAEDGDWKSLVVGQEGTLACGLQAKYDILGIKQISLRMCFKKSGKEDLLNSPIHLNPYNTEDG